MWLLRSWLLIAQILISDCSEITWLWAIKAQTVTNEISGELLEMSNQDITLTEKKRRGAGPSTRRTLSSWVAWSRPKRSASRTSAETWWWSVRLGNHRARCWVSAGRNSGRGQFVKLYVNGVRAFKELTNAGTRVFEVLYLEVQKNISQDRVYLSFTTLDDSVKLSQATFTWGIRELIDKGFAAPTDAVAWYWLNPTICGTVTDLVFVREYRWKKNSAQTYDPRQQSLELTDPEIPSDIRLIFS